jgi:GTPase SAR1 family protein
MDEYRANGLEPISTSKEEKMKKAIGAHAYIECSARFLDNVKEIFETAIRTVLHSPSVKQKNDLGGCGCEVA